MLSEKQHIDDFFRKKEEAFAPDNHLIDAHWQQMRTQLHEPGTEPEKRTPVNKHITKFLGLLVAGTVVLLLAINPFRHSKKKIVTTKQQTTVAVKKTKPGQQAVVPTDSLSVTEPTAAPQQDVSSQPRATTTLSLPEEQAIPPVADEPATSTLKLNNEAVNPKPTAFELLQQFYKQLEKEEQEFYINPNRDTTLIAKEGTRLFVPANTLLIKAQPAKGQIKIILREYYRYEDIIAAKLSTTSNGQQLVTGGMLHISAQQDGEPVTVAPQKAITVNMPTDNYDNRMQLFTGEEIPGITENSSTLNWLPVGMFQQSINMHGPRIKELNLNSVEPYSVNYGQKTIAKFYVAPDISIPVTEITARLKQRFGSYYDVIKLKRARKNSVYGRSDGGKPLVIDSTFIDVNKAATPKKRTTRDTLPNYDIIKQDAFYSEQQGRLRTTYRFALTNFGWYNCDRFSNDPRPKVNCKVNLPNGATAGNHISLLVFNRYRSVIQGNYYRDQIHYNNVPEGEQVLLITVAVTTDKVVSNIQALTTSNTVVSNLVFEPTTPEQFKQKLQSLFASQQQ